MTNTRGDLLAGSLEMLILRTLTLGSAHGYSIARHIEMSSNDVLRVEQGSLYPALDRLLRKGWVTAEWGTTPTGRNARYYTITKSGRTQLEERTAEHKRIMAAIARGLVNQPSILLLDEPFGALDALTRSRLQQELQNIWQREKITMILVTHDVDEAVFLGDRVVVMQPRPGRIKKIFPIDVAHPRDRSDPALKALTEEVRAQILEGSGKAS